jgi:hypothetical protein
MKDSMEHGAWGEEHGGKSRSVQSQLAKRVASYELRENKPASRNPQQ